MRRDPPHAALSGVRRAIDGIDDALLALLAGRRRLVMLAARFKRASGQLARDQDREREVYGRARRLGQLLGVPRASSDQLISLLITDACGQQGLKVAYGIDDRAPADLDQGDKTVPAGMLAPDMSPSDQSLPLFPWLRMLPPPSRWAPLLRRIPSEWQAQLLEVAMQRVLAAPVSSGALAALDSRRLGIEVSDLGLRWVVSLRDGRMQACAAGEAAESTVRGTATDLLLLASRREDADSLFFQRRLMLTGDIELGLTARNLLDQLPWSEVPLGLRIVLHRGAGLAQAARAAHRGEILPA